MEFRFYPTTLILDPSIVQTFFNIPIVSTFSWMGLLIMIGTLLGEYTVIDSTGQYSRTEVKQKVKKKRQIMWLLFAMFLGAVII